MAIVDTQKVDYLWKKLGYGRSKTDIESIKNATNESISSPLFLRGDTIWSQSGLIPEVIPASTAGVVQVYPTTLPVECVVDITASANRTWKTNLGDWIPPEIGATYNIKVYVHTAGQASNAASSGSQLFAAGSGNNDEWFFDYQSGTLNFIGTNLPNGINFTGKSVYISGARYTGIKGVPAPGAAITFTTVGIGSHLTVSGFSTFTNTADFNNGAYIDNIQIGITGDNEIDTTTGNLIIDSAGGTTTIDDKLIIVGLSTFNSNVDIDANLNVDSTLIVTGFSTFTNTADFNNGAYIDNIQIGITNDNEIDTSTGNLTIDSSEGTVTVDDRLIVTGITTFNSNVDIDANLNVDSTLIVTGLSTFTGAIDANGGATIDNVQIGITGNNEIDTSTGNLTIDSAEGTVTVDDRLIVTGISTFNSNVDIDANLNVDSTLIVTGIATFSNNIDANAGLDVDGFTELDATNISETLNVVGVSTFGSAVDINSNVDISGYLDVDGFTELDSTNISETLNVVGVSTFASAVDINSNVDISGYLDVDGHTELDYVNISGIVTATEFHTGSEGSFVRIKSDSITGPSTITIDPAGVGDNTGLVIIKGNLQVDGTQTIINSTSVTVDDLNIMLADGAANDAAANGGGITVQSGEGNKTFQFESTGDNFGSSENLNLASGKTYKIANTEVLSATKLTVANINSSGIGTIETLDTTTGTIDYLTGTTLNLSGLSTFASAVDINSDLDVDGFTELDATNISETLNVVGVSTFASAVDINSDLDVDGFTELDAVNISETLNVVGVSTFGSFIDANGGLDVTGHTELDNLNVSGVSTFVGLLDANGGATIDNVRIGVAGDNTIDTSTGGLTLDSNSGTVTVDDNLAISGTNTLSFNSSSFNINHSGGNANIFNGAGDLILGADGNKSISLERVGVATLAKFTHGGSADLYHNGIKRLETTGYGVTVYDTLQTPQLNVTGLSTFASAVDINSDLDVDGFTELDAVNISETLNVAGLSTFGSAVDINSDLDVDGFAELDAVNISETLNVVGLSTFASAVDINSNVDISGYLDVDGHTELDNVNVSGVTTFQNNVYLGDSDVLNFGDDSDLKIWHNGSNSIINDEGIGDLYLGGNSNVIISNAALDEIKAKFITDGAVELYHDNSKKFETTGYGSTIFGTLESQQLSVTGLSTFASAVDINSDLDVDGFTELDAVNISETLNVVGLSTFASAVDINAGLDVDGFTELDSTNISETLNVVGVSTFASAVDINSDLDVDGFTELDATNISETLNVVGLSTFGSAVDINSNLDVDGFTELDSTNISETLNVVGVSTFGSAVDINAGLDVDGFTELDATNISETLNVVGLSTFGSDVDINAGLDVDGFTELDSTNISETLNVVGVSTFGSAVDINSNVDISGYLDVDGQTELDNINVSGLSTFASNLDVNASVDISGELVVDGTSDLDELNVVGLSTFASNLDINASVDISGYLDVDGQTELDNVNVSGISTFAGAIDVNGDGHDIAGTIALDNVNVSGVVTATRFDGNLNALGKTYYVATTGSNSNSGDNINEPFLTIAQALSVATNGDIVNISAGIFEETCPLTVPRGVTVKGAGLRATTIKPTNATKQENIFLLNDISTVEDFTVRGSYFNSSADTGYAFSYATGIAITTRSPYVQRVTVLNTGSITSASDPYGYDTADSAPTSYVAGAGAKIDGALVAYNSLEAGMLFNEVTFFTPNQKGIVLTNGARAEYLNCFHYFASQAIVGLAGTVGIAGTADARLKVSGITTTPVVNDVIKLYSGGVGIATGTITSYSNDYLTIDGLGIGTFTSVGIGSTQDVRFYQSDGTTQTGIASAILLADYTMFGAEMRSVGCAVEYGSQGVVADGNGVKLRMFATNFNHVGSGKDFTNDSTLTVQANEVIELNNGQVSYVSIDQSGDFRVGDSLYINQETGNVSFAATSYSLEVTGELDVKDGTNTSTLTPTSLTVGGLQLAANTLSSVSGNIIIDPAGSNKTIVQGDLGVVGILTAQVLTADSLQKGDTSIAIDDTGSNGTITFYTDNVEAFRVNNQQVIVFTGNIDANGTLDVDGFTELDAVNISETLNVVGLSTFTALIDANGGLSVTGNINTDQLSVSGVTTSPTFDTTSTRTGSATSTTTTTSQTAIHTGLASASYRSVEYLVQAVEGTNFHTTKILIVHDGTTAYLTEYGSVYNNSSVATYDVDISGGNIRLLATPASVLSTTFKISFTTIVV